VRSVQRRCLLALLLAAPLNSVAAPLCGGFNTALSFGTVVSGSDTAADSLTSFDVRCVQHGDPLDVTVTVGLGPSAGSGAIHRRYLTAAGGQDRLEYNLYRDPARLSVWGSTPGVDTVTRTLPAAAGNVGVLSFTIFGRIPPGQEVRVGDYGDQILITVDF
jgi:spore coat protein U-like protein